MVYQIYKNTIYNVSFALQSILKQYYINTEIRVDNSLKMQMLLFLNCFSQLQCISKKSSLNEPNIA